MNSIVRARRKIESDILNGLLYPRQRLIEEEIATRLGMSRTPVREALKQLEVKGLATRLPTRGLVVTAITAEEIQNTFVVREALETTAIRLVCDKIPEKAVEKLNKYLVNHEKEVEKFFEFGSSIDPHWSILFHSQLYAACNNPKLINFIKDLWDIERLTTASKYFKESEYSVFNEQHREIMQSIRKRDQEQAVEAVKAHLSTMHQIYLKYV